MTEQPEACLFDLDGVIVDTAHNHFKAWQRLAETLDIHFTEKENRQLKGLSRRKSILRILEMGDKSLPEEKIQVLMDKKNGWYRDSIAELGPDHILPGIPAILDELEEKEIKKAIGSSSKNARFILERLELTERFGAIVDGADVKNTKPDPEVFLKGARLLDAEPEGCIVFEDATSGVEAANRAGMKSVGVGNKDHFTDADAVISSFKGLNLNNILALL